MCGERNIPSMEHNESIQPGIHLNESKLHLTIYGNIAFARSITDYLLNFD